MTRTNHKKKRRAGLLLFEIILLIILLAAAVAVAFLRRSSEPATASTAPVSPSVPSPSAAAVPSPPPEDTVTLGGQILDPALKELTLEGSVDFNELRTVLSKLAKLESVDAAACPLTDNEKRALLAAYGDISFLWSVDIDGKSFDSTVTALEIPSPDKADVYAASADLLPNVEKIKLGGGDYSPAQAAALAEACPGASLEGSIFLFGKSFPTDSEELDFSGTRITVEETAVFDRLITAMPGLKKVIMSDCGISDEEMDALDLSHEDVRFVWTVHFKVYDVRTDADRFCVSDLPWNEFVAWPMTDQDFAPIKYCRDLEALDLGHENVSDLSFLYNMPKMKYLIVAIVHNKLDLTPIASLQELYYLEVFHNEIDDLSPLTECKALRHLNIGNCSGDFSLDPLYEMTWLDRLWFPMNHLSDEEKDRLTSALPDTDVYLGMDDEVGGGWRKSEVYDEMHAALFKPA